VESMNRNERKALYVGVRGVKSAGRGSI
jgi:hypothetical protein